MSTEVQKAAIKFLNDQVRECKSDEDYLKLVGKLVGAKTSKKKLFETLGLEPEEEVKEPTAPEADETGDGEDN